MGRHGLHELQACTLVVGAQEGAAVAVDGAYPLQCSEEALIDVLALHCHSMISAKWA